MKKKKVLNKECGYFFASMIDDIAWIELKGNMMLRSINLQCRDELIDYLDGVSEDESVKIVVLVHSEESTGYEKYAEYYQKVGHRKLSENDVWRTSVKARKEYSRGSNLDPRLSSGYKTYPA